MKHLFKSKPQVPYKIFKNEQILINSSCTEKYGLQNIKSNSVDLVVTSPPYNIGIKYDTYIDDIPWNTYYDNCRVWLKECYRILKSTGRLCINHYISCNSLDKVKQYPLMKINSIACEELKFKHYTLSLWTDRTLGKLTAWGSFMSASAPFVAQPYEGILTLYKDKWKKEHKGESTISKEDFITGCSGLWGIEPDKERLTKATFPVKIPELCIDLYSYKGDIVVDPFGGSGTTTKASIIKKRKCISFELSPNYYDISINRTKREIKRSWMFNKNGN